MIQFFCGFLRILVLNLLLNCLKSPSRDNHRKSVLSRPPGRGLKPDYAIRVVVKRRLALSALTLPTLLRRKREKNGDQS